MKDRILDSLVSFSQPEAVNSPPEMLLQIAAELNLTSEEIQAKAKKILKHLLHHYASFSVETIDSFNHRLIRTFARDLKLATNFEVSLDTSLLLSEAVDQLINKAGEDPEITKVLLEFALEKADDDKSWDITNDIINTAKILFVENEIPHLNLLKDKNLGDFAAFKKQLLLRKKNLSEKIIKTAQETLNLIETRGIAHNDFSSSYLPKHFLNLESGRTDLNFSAKWQEDIDQKPLYPKRVDGQTAAIIDEIAYFLKTNFDSSKNNVHQIQLINAILKNLTQLSVINLINHEISLIKEEKNIIPISEFNALINNEIKDQPAPFIYERLGEKFRHFFIDEFQDTSQLQWKNMIPLIENAVSQFDQNQQSGTLMLVGDAKQSIYRWRGGLPEQFMDLYGGLNPFPSVEKKLLNLDTNYRSCEEIIRFNNRFFTYVADVFGDNIHKDLYITGNHQKFTTKQDGYVKIEFVEKQVKVTKDEVYAIKIQETIQALINKGFSHSDICILTRFKSDGITIGKHLMENDIKVISSETLMLQSSSLVKCIVNALKISVYPENDEAKIAWLDFLHEHLNIPKEKHHFFSELVKKSDDEFEAILQEYGIDFNIAIIRSLSIYESCEYCIRKLNLQSKADAFLFSFMDLVFEFEQKPQATKISFLDHWEIQKEKASIPATESNDAVRIMTIHKSKGLEFPVVIFPYADLKIYNSKHEMAWFPLDMDENSGFRETQIKYNQELESFGELGNGLFRERQNMMELDSINLLYVTLTRAVEQLYIFAEEPGKKVSLTTTYNQLLDNFLQQYEGNLTAPSIYEFGKPERISSKDNKVIPVNKVPIFLATTPLDHHLKIITNEASLWNTDAEAAIALGNELHDIMSMIIASEDIVTVFEGILERGIITSESIANYREKVEAIVSHPELRHLFEATANAENEKDIITASGMLLRPDRINLFDNNLVTIVDYKTGTPDYHHEDQINSYAKALEEMGKKVSEKILVYTNQPNIVINKV